MPNEKFLITRPNHDDRVSYLHNWGKEILLFADKNNIKYSDFEGKEANRNEVTKFLQKQNPKLVLFNGHGIKQHLNMFFIWKKRIMNG